MIKIKDIEKAVVDLPAKDFAEFRAWFQKVDAEKWDKQFESDVKTGKLNQIAQKAITDFKKGKYKEL